MAIPTISQEQMVSALDQCYDLAVKGLPTSPTCKDLADQYLERYKDLDTAVSKMIRAQVQKCTTSGFLTNIGGLITIPVAVPANLASVLYVQLRMIATIAVMGGYEPSDDEVQTMVYACLAGMSVTDVCKAAGIKVANKATTNMILKRVSGETLKKINKAVGFRLVTKAGSTGIINLTKMVPLLGGAVGAGVDYFGTKSIAKKAYKEFITEEVV